MIGCVADGCAAMDELLERGSYTVLRAWDLEGALSTVENDRPDAAIIDCGQSYQDGLALLTELSSRACSPPIIVIIKNEMTISAIKAVPWP